MKDTTSSIGLTIVLVTHQFLPDHSAGTEVLVYETAQALIRLGHTVIVFTSGPGEWSKEEAVAPLRKSSVDQIPVVIHGFGYRTNGLVWPEYDHPSLGQQFGQWLDEVCPDIVHFFHFSRISSAALSACCSRFIPTIFTVTDYWAICATGQLMLPSGDICSGPTSNGINCLRHWLSLSSGMKQNLGAALPEPALNAIGVISKAGFLKKSNIARSIANVINREIRLQQLLQQGDCFLVATRFMQETLQNWGIPAAKIRQQTFGIPHSMSTVRTPCAGRDDLHLGFIGTLDLSKGVEVLLTALGRLTHTGRLRLSIWGDTSRSPEYSERLLALAERVGGVRFRGKFLHSQIGEVLKEIDLLAVPSIWHENSPLVLGHAQASRCPVVGSDVPGIAERIQSDHLGWTFPRGDAQALATLLDKLMANPEKIDAVSRNMRHVKTIDDYATELVDLYRNKVSAKELL